MDGLTRHFGIRFSEPVRDPIWKNILLPAEFLPVIDSPEFVQLSRIHQLGPAHLVYPGATHTRRAHSLGVFEMAKRLLGSLADEELPAVIDEAGARSFLMAALCHDLGHFPYAHSLKELPLTDHEELTARVVTGPLYGVICASGADPGMVAAIVDETQPGGGEALSLFRRLLSGVLDPDKLDYLNRDAWACGVPYGVQDVDFILQHVGLDDSGRPGVDERGVMAVESVLFSKYQMYRAVYWHRSVRAATAMIKKAVAAALASEAVKPEDLYGLDDPGFYERMGNHERDPSGLIASVRRGALLRTCYEAPFDAELPLHASAGNLSLRPGLEAELCRAIGSRGGTAGNAAAVIIDLPEPISFESDLPVLGTGMSFSEYATVFRPGVVSSFARALRVLRVFTDADPVAVSGIVAEALGGIKKNAS